MKKNGKKNEKKTSKKLFQKGGPGGPGRGKGLSELDLNDDEFWDELAKMVTRHKGKGETDRLKMLALLVKIKTKKDEHEAKTKPKEPDCYHPAVINLLQLRNLLPMIGGSVDEFELVKRMYEVCPTCDRLGGSPIDIEVPEP